MSNVGGILLIGEVLVIFFFRVVWFLMGSEVKCVINFVNCGKVESSGDVILLRGVFVLIISDCFVLVYFFKLFMVERLIIFLIFFSC